MGAFYLLVPYLLKVQIYKLRLVSVNFFLQSIGISIIWCAGFFTEFNALYTLYWPLPVWFERVSNLGSVVIVLGAAMVLVNILLFTYNIFATIVKRQPLNNQEPALVYRFGDYLKSAFGIDRIFKKYEGKQAKSLYDTLPVFIVAVVRGSIDTVINAFVILTCGVLILIFALPPLLCLGAFNPNVIDALVYKNWFR